MNELRIAGRSLSRQLGFTATVILTLAICIAANTVIFAIVNSVILRPLPVANANRLVLMSNRYPKAGAGELNWSSVGDYYDRQIALTSLDKQALFRPSDRTIEIGGSQEQVTGLGVTPSLFDLIEAKPSAGRLFLSEEGELGAEERVILSTGLARDLFGSTAAALGKSVRMSARPYLVVGVMPAGFRFVNPEVRFWVPLAFDAETKRAHHNNNWHHVGRLAPGRTIAQVQSQVDALNAANLEREPNLKQVLIEAGFHTRVEPLEQLLVKNVRGSLYLLWGGALFVLLIGGLNVANLMLARSNGRRREIACRAALGASRFHLARQLIAENFLLAAVGGIVGVLLGTGVLAALSRIGLDRFPRADEVQVDGWVVAVSIGLALMALLLVGLASFWEGLRVNVSDALHDGSRGGTGGMRRRFVRHILVAAEVGFAFALLLGAGLLLTSFRNLLDADLGYDGKNVWTASTSAPRARYSKDSDLETLARRTLEGVRTLPGVKAAGISDSLPFDGTFSDSVIFAEGYQQKPGESVISPLQVSVTPGYFETMGLQLVRGRMFDERDHGNALRTIIVDERIARRFWPDQDPIGKRMRFPSSEKDLYKVDANTRWMTVVGVVKEARVRDLTSTGTLVGMCYHSFYQAPSRGFSIAVKTAAEGDPGSMLRAVRSELARVDSELALFDAHTMPEREYLALSSRRMALVLALSFGFIALFLAGIGVYGVLAFSVAERRREIGIRMALGSTSGGVARLVLSEGLMLTGAGLLCGAIGAVLLRRVMEGEVYGVGALDPLVWISVASLFLIIGIAAGWIPAARAARVNPAQVLTD